MTLLEHTPGQAMLVRPTLAMQASFLEAAHEYRDNGEELDPAFPAYWCTPFHAYIEQLEALVKGRHLPLSMVPAETFWLASADGRFLGLSRLRHHLNRSLHIEGGHIGYSIRPSERRKGYGTQLCAFTIQEARQHRHFVRLLITCDTSNTASARIIEKNGGILQNYAISPRTGRQVSRYWVKL